MIYNSAVNPATVASGEFMAPFERNDSDKQSQHFQGNLRKKEKKNLAREQLHFHREFHKIGPDEERTQKKFRPTPFG
jgi:hypothetical protein